MASKGMALPQIDDSAYGPSYVGTLGYGSWRWGIDAQRFVGGALSSEGVVNAAVRACILRWLMAYSAAPLRIYDADDELVKAHPLIRRMRRPNPWMSWPQYHRVKKLYKLLGGNCYVHIVRAEDATPLELYPYHDGHFTPIPGEVEWIETYRFRFPDGRTKDIAPSEIIHLSWVMPSVSEPWKGESVLVSIAAEAGMDQEMTRIIQTYLRNDAVLRGYLLDEKGAAVTEDQKRLLEESWNSRSSTEKRGKTPVLRGGIKYVPVQSSLSELDLTPLRNVPEDRIAANFLISNIYSGLTSGQQSTTYDNLNGARQFFFEDAVVPVWQTDAEEYTVKLLPPDSTEYFWFYTKDVIALRRDLNAISARVISQWEKNLITLNEARAALELEPVEEALDGFYTDVVAPPPPPSQNPEPEGSEAQEEQPPNSEGSGEGEDEPAGRSEDTRGRASGGPAGKSDDSVDGEAEAKAYWKRFDDPAETVTGKLEKEISKAFETLERIVLTRVPAKSRKDRDSWLPWPSDEAVVKLLTTGTRPLLEAFLGEVFADAVGLLGVSWDDVESEFDEAMAEALVESTSRITETIPTVKSELQALLAANAEAGADRLTQLIKEKFSQYSDGKARTIARTTATFATNRALDDTATELDGQKLWLTQRDGDVRDSHRKADGQVAVDGMFMVGGKRGRHPGALGSGDEDINCRCVVRIRPKE